MSVLSQAWWVPGIGGPVLASNQSIFHPSLAFTALVAFAHLLCGWLCGGVPGVAFWRFIRQEGVAVTKPGK